MLYAFALSGASIGSSEKLSAEHTIRMDDLRRRHRERIAGDVAGYVAKALDSQPASEIEDYVRSVAKRAKS